MERELINVRDESEDFKELFGEKEEDCVKIHWQQDTIDDLMNGLEVPKFKKATQAALLNYGKISNHYWRTKKNLIIQKYYIYMKSSRIIYLKLLSNMFFF